MRNGIYRVWVNGPTASASGAFVLNDGDLFAVNSSFGFVGRYEWKSGRLSAELICRRLSNDNPPVNLPNLDEFHLHLEGPARREVANLTGTIAEAPGYTVPFEFAWLCDA